MSMSKEKSQILEIVCKDGWELQNLEDQWKSDKEVVLAAVGNLGHALEFAEECTKTRRIFCRNGKSIKQISSTAQKLFNLQM